MPRPAMSSTCLKRQSNRVSLPRGSCCARFSRVNVMSSTEHLIDLVNRVADGEASAAEQAELQRLMHDSAEARVLFAETREVFRRLDSLPEVDPPHQLRNDILESTHPTNFPSADLYFPLTDTKRGGNMSADRRKQMLIGFGGLAV